MKLKLHVRCGLRENLEITSKDYLLTYIESLSRTVKCMPKFPHAGFETQNRAREWTHEFVKYYNLEHRNSGLKYIAPKQRYNGDYEKYLKKEKSF